MTHNELENHVRDRLALDQTRLTQDQKDELMGYYEKTLAGEKLTCSQRARIKLLVKDLKLRTKATG